LTGVILYSPRFGRRMPVGRATTKFILGERVWEGRRSVPGCSPTRERGNAQDFARGDIPKLNDISSRKLEQGDGMTRGQSIAQEQVIPVARVKRGTLPDNIDRLVPKERRGLIVVITGNGKGKTTSALGMALRACGHGLRVCIIQFMKGDIFAGEWEGIKKLDCDIELHATGKGFCGILGNPYPYAEHRDNADDAIDLAREKMESGAFDLLILDEINNAIKLKLVALEQVLGILRDKPPLMHLVLTGRDAHPEVIELADTVSEVNEIKHAYRQGIDPQPGIDY
jgi:cob(I)alamin adenosyltransferase